MGEGSSGRCCPEDPSKTHSSDATYRRSRRTDRREGGSQGDRRRRNREVVRGGDGEELGKGGGCQGDSRRRHREVVTEKQRR